VSLRKSANLLYGLGRFAEAHELYERLFSEGKDRSVAGRLCLCSLQSGNRTAAEEYFLSLDPTKIEHAEAYAAFHFVPNDDASVSAGLSFIAMFPRSVFLEFPKSLQDAYLDFAKRRIQTLPKFRNGMSPRELGENFWDSFGALRAFSAVLSDDVSNAVAYFRFLRSMFSVGFSESAIGVPVAEIFIETLRPIHGVSFSGSYSEPQDSATRQALIFNLFRQEAETFAIDFFESSLTDTETYVEMLLGISAIFEDFGNRPLAAEYRIRASETMDGDISGPHGAGNATVH
jgi:tetratricopeptide (TPR) repeat protein